MTDELFRRLEKIEVAECQESSGLQVFGLRACGNGGASLVYATLEEALEAQTLEITEVSEGGSVPDLKVVNRGGIPVFLMAGEQLVGAKQNRVLNASILVPANTTVLINVSCVESGRWGYRSRKFSSKGTMSHSILRRMMSRHADKGYRDRGTPTSDQHEVWREVSRKLRSMGSASPTQAVDQVYEDYHERMAELLRRVNVPAGCAGAAFVLGGKVAGVDLFDKPETLAKLWLKLVPAYAVDALEIREGGGTPTPLPTDAVAQWIRSASRMEGTTFKSPGAGNDVRLTGPDIFGAALVVDDHPIHVELFPSESQAPQG
jgi:hypothetical protein